MVKKKKSKKNMKDKKQDKPKCPECEQLRGEARYWCGRALRWKNRIKEYFGDGATPEMHQVGITVARAQAAHEIRIDNAIAAKIKKPADVVTVPLREPGEAGKADDAKATK